MRYTNEFLGLMKNPRYKLARLVFNDLISGNAPDEKVLKKLYKNSYKSMLSLSKDFKITGELRKHVNAPSLITDARLATVKDNNYRKIHHELLKFQIPEIKHLKKFFGEYSKTVQTSYKLFIEAKKTRKSGISMTCHHNRVACTFYELIKDNPEVNHYASIAALHDFVEDLMYSLKDEEGNRYTIENYEAFLNKFIPKDLQEPIQLLTNHYDMILKYVDYHLDRQGKRFNKENLLEFLGHMKPDTMAQLGSFVRKIMLVVRGSEYTETSSKDYLEEMKWKCYTELYIPELVKISYKDKEHLLLLVKLVDLSDNNNALEGMDLPSKIKNIRKSIITCDLISKLDKAKLLEDYVLELSEDALVKAEFLVIKDLMMQESVLDFYVDALVKIEKMKDVFCH
ncbi:TPA: hypothetical protein HA235_06370 [Candidatus Woesearchaeota archaeon]|nr:hypothetical protein [Candidatus Woesearchaeota archaeon]HIH32303.1 hypothetical protein [Candidatus Woesearchaeota archaeon]HIJ02063.1 hypothetical protein [Candidatus Woesearchaeota archaeon]HIJ13819.1 hypothetical protein [Candidatus Woesearchaeota archaeon]